MASEVIIRNQEIPQDVYVYRSSRIFGGFSNDLTKTTASPDWDLDNGSTGDVQSTFVALVICGAPIMEKPYGNPNV